VVEPVEAPFEVLSPGDVSRYREALNWAEGQVRALAPPSPSPASTPVPPTGTPVPLSSTPVPRVPGFNPDQPTELQVQDWTSAIVATKWMVISIGRNVTSAEMQNLMSPRYVRSDVGLLDISGAGVVAALREGFGLSAANQAFISFDEVAARAGRQPMMMCGRSWGHCTAVRNMSPDQRILLANPGGTGPRYGQQSLSREQFEVLGPFSAAWIEP